MKRRYVYSILFGVPGLVLSLIIAAAISASVAGILWIFVFGDNPWPPGIDKAFGILFVFVFLVAWLASLIIGFRIAKQFEPGPRLNRKHVLISIGVTGSLVLLIVLQQLSVGNIGPKSIGTRCSEFCSRQGYSASTTSPRDFGTPSCSCLSSSGLDVLTIAVDALPP